MNTVFCEKLQTNIDKTTCHEMVLRGTDNSDLLFCKHCAYGIELMESCQFSKKPVKRKEPLPVCLYARVGKKTALNPQLDRLNKYCLAHEYTILSVYKDVSIAISEDRTKDFFSLVQNIMDGKIQTLLIDKKEVLSKDSFEFFQFIFKKYNCTILLRE